MKIGEKVLLPEYGGTKVILDDKVQQSLFLANWTDLFPLLSSMVTFCFSYLTSRTISCSVMAISSVNTSNESLFFVAVDPVPVIPGERKKTKLNGLSCLLSFFSLFYFYCK